MLSVAGKSIILQKTSISSILMIPSLPKLSCLGSVYSGSCVSETVASINSLINSDFSPDELVLVVDGPVSHEMSSALEQLELNGSIKLVPLVFNQGLGKALSCGLCVCSNDIVVRFDTDDLNLDNRLFDIASRFASNPDLDIVGSAILEFLPSDQIFVNCRFKRVPLADNEIKFALSYKNPINHPSVAFRKSSILSIGSYEHIPFFEDYFLWLKARKARLKFANISSPLVMMRRPPLSSRRSGLGYALHEFSFYKKAISLRLLSPLFIFIFMLRILSRFLPAPFQLFQDFLPWRSRQTHCLNPKFLSCLSISSLDIV